MKQAKKKLLLFSVFVLCLGFSLTAQAADKRFKKETVVFQEGQSKTLTLLNSDSWPTIMYYDADTSLFSYEVRGNSKIKVTANRPGIDYIMVSNGNTNISCCLVIMPKANPAVRLRETKKEKTVVTYKKIRVILPDAWKKYGYVILTDDTSIAFHSKSSYRTGYYGWLFSIEWCSAAEYAERKTYLPDFSFLKQNGNTVYYITFPTDVQFNTEKTKCIRQYRALEKTINSIQKSFKLKK